MTKLLSSLLRSKLNSAQVTSASQEVRDAGVNRAVLLYTVYSPVGPMIHEDGGYCPVVGT